MDSEAATVAVAAAAAMIAACGLSFSSSSVADAETDLAAANFTHFGEKPYAGIYFYILAYT